MFIIKRAIIMAAGQGTRLRPLTDTTPKPLISLNNKPMIESIIESLLKNNITEIYIVIGYLKEHFYYLQTKYPQIKLIVNQYYATCNNISSLYTSKNYLSDVVIIDGDQIINNENILDRNCLISGYCCTWTELYTKEWLLHVIDYKVKSCNIDGGKDGWRLYGVSFWDRTQGKILHDCLIHEFDIKRNRNIYWDDVWRLNLDKFSLGIRKIAPNDIYEIDTIDELIAIDSSYRN